MSVDETVLNLCVWYKSGSIVANNEMYVQCHSSCLGMMKSCPYYISKPQYFRAKLETCKKLNAKKAGEESV